MGNGFVGGELMVECSCTALGCGTSSRTVFFFLRAGEKRWLASQGASQQIEGLARLPLISRFLFLVAGLKGKAILSGTLDGHVFAPCEQRSGRTT